MAVRSDPAARSDLLLRRLPELGLIRPAFRPFDGGIHGHIERCVELPERIGGFRDCYSPAFRCAENVQQKSAVLDRPVIHRCRRLDCFAPAIFLVLAARDRTGRHGRFERGTQRTAFGCIDAHGTVYGVGAAADGRGGRIDPPLVPCCATFATGCCLPRRELPPTASR